jgi:hypothetical protein
MQPLKITAYLAGSIAIARPEDISLDGILAYQVLRRHFGEEFYLLPNPQEVLRFARLPLAVRGYPDDHVKVLATGDVWMNTRQGIIDDSLWYWSCSSAQIDVKGRDTQYWNKRFDAQAGLSDHIDFGGRVEKIIIEQGRYKSYHMPLTTLICEKVEWFAYGDIAQIHSLLFDIPAIGKKRSYGNGQVLRWEIEGVDHDYSEWRSGELMRPIPGPLFDQGKVRPLDIQHIGFRAPQWHSANQCMCVTRGMQHA